MFDLVVLIVCMNKFIFQTIATENTFDERRQDDCELLPSTSSQDTLGTTITASSNGLAESSNRFKRLFSSGKSR